MLTRPEELVALIEQIAQESTLNFKSILTFDDDKIPEYPALIISSPNVRTSIHGTNMLRTYFTTILYILHADASVDRKRRNLDDLALATSFIKLLEAPWTDPADASNVGAALTMRDQVRAGYVEGEIGGPLPVGSKKGVLVVSTRLTHTCFVQNLFNRATTPAFQ